MKETKVLRVLALNYEFPPIGGGGGNAHRQILRRFCEFPDLQVTLLTSTPQSRAYSELYCDSVRIEYLPLKKRDLHYWRRSEVLRYLWTHARFLKKHLRENQYDLCHVFFGFPSGLLAYLNRKHFPYIVSVRGSDVPGYNRRFSLDYIALQPLFRRIYGQAAGVVANSAGLRELYEQAFPGLKAEVIPNGIDTDFFKPMERVESKPFLLVTVARLIPRKGIDVLIRACHSLAQQGVEHICHVVGEGPEEEPLQQLAAKLGVTDRFRFHGRLEPAAVAQLLPQCDVFVLPSYAEGMSNAALEAMACGLPLVLTDTGGTRELIQDNGKVFPAGNPYSLTTILKELYQNPGLRQAMAERSRAHALQLSWQNVARQYHDLYQRVYEEHAGHVRV